MERSPAHKIVPKKIDEALNELIAKEQGRCPDAFRADTLAARLLMGVMILKNMVIPDKHIDEVRQKLEEILSGQLPEIGQKIIRFMLLPANIFAGPTRMEKREPAHIVIPHLMRDAITNIAGQTDISRIRIAPFVGHLTMGIDTLREMIIPEKHLTEVSCALHKIRTSCPPSAYAQIFVGSIVPGIIPAPSEPPNPSYRPDEMPDAMAVTNQLPAKSQAIANTIADPAM